MFGSTERIATSGLPLEITCSPRGEVSQEAGATFTLSVIVRNRSDRDVLLVLSIDESAGIMHQWCASPRTFFALAPRQVEEAFFLLDIPFSTPAGIYPYAIKVDSPKHYRDALPVFYRGNLRVLPPTREAQRGGDPTFSLSPATQPETPLPLQPGAVLSFSAQVANRSERVDRFQIVCPDAPADWVRVSYPAGATTNGIVRDAEALELNPGQEGLAQLTISPPLTARAGVYPLAVRLTSTNDPTLVLLEIVHLQVQATYQLSVELQPQLDRIVRGPARFQFRANNQGNTPRTVTLKINDADEGGRCRYRLDKEEFTLLPGAQELIGLVVEPPAGWQRSFAGEAFTFWSDVGDRQDLPVLTPRLQGTWFWKPRPWWQFLLILLALLGTVGAIVLLALWWLRRPVPQLRIDAFRPTSDVYLELDDRPIQLNWQIANPQQISSLQLQGLSPEGEVLSPPVTYDFAEGIPAPLQNVCAIAAVLNCAEVPTDARQAGEYRFQLTVVPRQQNLPPVSITANRARIEPPPQAIAFAPTPMTDPAAEAGGIRLDWEIENFSQVKTALLTPSRSDGQPVEIASQVHDFRVPDELPAAIAPFCSVRADRLSCSRVPTGVKDPGTYVYDLTLVPRSVGATALQAARTDPIVIAPPPIPLQIETFTVDGLPALPVYRLNPLVKNFLRLDWAVRGDPGLTVEVLPAPGTVEPEGTLIYPLGPEPKRETISLQVADRAGNKQTRTIVVETFVPAPVALEEPEPTSDLVPPEPPEPPEPSALPEPQLSPRELLERDTTISPSEPMPRF